MSCTIRRSGDIETSSGPFGDRSGEEELLRGEFEAPREHGPVLAAMGRIGELINEDGEDVNLFVNSAEHIEAAPDDIDEARGSDDPPPTQHGPNRHIFKQRYAIFDKNCLDCGETFLNHALLRKRAPFSEVSHVGELLGKKNKCDICGPYISGRRKLRYFDTFDSALDITNGQKEFDRLSSIAVYPPPRGTWETASD